MSDIPNLAERLAAANAAFQEATPDSGSIYDPPPDGRYGGLVHEFDWFEGGTPSQLWLKTRLIVQTDEDGNESEFAGRMGETIHAVEDPERLGRLKYHLNLLGAEKIAGEDYPLTAVAPNSELMRALLDTPVLFTVKTSANINPKTGKPYVNVYVDEALGDPGSGADDNSSFTSGFAARPPASDVPNDTSGFQQPLPAGAATDDDDIPF